MKRKEYTVKELKDVINSIDEKYDDLKVVVDDPHWGGEGCLGSSFTTVQEVLGNVSNSGYYIEVYLN